MNDGICAVTSLSMSRCTFHTAQWQSGVTLTRKKRQLVQSVCSSNWWRRGITVKFFWFCFVFFLHWAIKVKCHQILLYCHFATVDAFKTNVWLTPKQCRWLITTRNNSRNMYFVLDFKKCGSAGSFVPPFSHLGRWVYMFLHKDYPCAH